MATRKRTYLRPLYLAALLVALLLSAGAIASGVLAAPGASLPVGKAPASVPLPACYPPPPGMVAWYTLDETSGTSMNDHTGAYNGTYFNNPTINLSQYVLNSRQFNGTNQWGEANPGPDFGAGDFSVDAWVNVPVGSGTPNVFLDKRDITPIGYEMFVYNGLLGVQVADSSGYSNYIRTTSPINDGQWHFVAVVVQRSPYLITLQVDGTTQSFSNNPRTGSVTNSRALRVGRHWPNNADLSDHYFQGSIDEVELFNRALASTELNSIFNAQSAGKCKDSTYEHAYEHATNTPTATANNPCGPLSNYAITQSVGAYNYNSGTLVPGSQCDDCVVNVPIPFTFYLYGIPHTSVNASSNGNLQFTSNNPAFNNNCLIEPTMGDTIFPQWDNLDTSTGTCGPACGLYTYMTGPLGNRHFFMRWQAVLFATTQLVRFQVDLYEATGFNNESTFQIIYGDFVGGNGTGATVGVQKGGGPQFTQYECNTGGTIPDRVLTFSQVPCTTATPTPTQPPVLSITIIKLNDVNNQPVPDWPHGLAPGWRLCRPCAANRPDR